MTHIFAQRPLELLRERRRIWEMPTAHFPLFETLTMRTSEQGLWLLLREHKRNWETNNRRKTQLPPLYPRRRTSNMRVSATRLWESLRERKRSRAMSMARLPLRKKSVMLIIAPGLCFFIAEARAELGDADDALAIAQRINNADSRARALISVAKAQTRAEDHQSARETFAAALSASRRIDSASFLAAVLRDIAKAQMRAGYVQDARDTFAAALHTARKIQYRDFRAKSLAAIAEAQAGFGDQWPARDAFAEALSVARHVSNADGRPWVFYAVAEAQANVDDFRGAMKTAVEIQVDGVRARALAVIAKILAMREKN